MASLALSRYALVLPYHEGYDYLRPELEPCRELYRAILTSACDDLASPNPIERANALYWFVNPDAGN